MSDLRKAAEMAFDYILREGWTNSQGKEVFFALSQVLEESANSTTSVAEPKTLAQPEQESVTLLPDGSAFGVMSFPLPDSHWLYAKREYRDGEYEPIELGKPILTYKLRDAVVSAVRYAIRGATNCGKEMDFDPDALVQNAVYALCGPHTRHVDAVNTSQECVDETAKSEHEPVAWVCRGVYSFTGHCPECEPLYTAPPKREWVGLTGLEQKELMAMNSRDAVFETEAKLKEKNT